MSGFKPKIGGLQSLLAQEETRKKEEAANALQKAGKEPAFEYAPPEKASQKIRIIFDDSGSMGGQKILDAHEGCIEFMRNCAINDTAVAIHPMNYTATDMSQITTNLPALSVLLRDVKVSGSTPMFETWQKATKLNPKANRYIIFSDGAPNNLGWYLKDILIEEMKELKTPVDTVLIAENSYESSETSPAYQLMKEVADKTGGIFLVFDRSKVNFKSAFKYLAPSLRLQLAASTDMQRALQEGKLS